MAFRRGRTKDHVEDEKRLNNPRKKNYFYDRFVYCPRGLFMISTFGILLKPPTWESDSLRRSSGATFPWPTQNYSKNSRVVKSRLSRGPGIMLTPAQDSRQARRNLNWTAREISLLITIMASIAASLSCVDRTFLRFSFLAVHYQFFLSCCDGTVKIPKKPEISSKHET